MLTVAFAAHDLSLFGLRAPKRVHFARLYDAVNAAISRWIELLDHALKLTHETETETAASHPARVRARFVEIGLMEYGYPSVREMTLIADDPLGPPRLHRYSALTRDRLHAVKRRLSAFELLDSSTPDFS